MKDENKLTALKTGDCLFLEKGFDFVLDANITEVNIQGNGDVQLTVVYYYGNHSSSTMEYAYSKTSEGYKLTKVKSFSYPIYIVSNIDELNELNGFSIRAERKKYTRNFPERDTKGLLTEALMAESDEIIVPDGSFIQMLDKLLGTSFEDDMGILRTRNLNESIDRTNDHYRNLVIKKQIDELFEIEERENMYTVRDKKSGVLIDFINDYKNKEKLTKDHYYMIIGSRLSFLDREVYDGIVTKHLFE